MIVGLNLLYLLPGTVGGTETYAAGLLGALAEAAGEIRFKVFVNRESERWPLPESPAFERVVCPVRAAGRLARYRWEQLVLPRWLRGAHRVDILHSLGYVAPLLAPCPSVVTLHDLNYRAFGDRMPRSRRLVLRFFAEQSARRAARVLTVSEFSREAIITTLGLPAERVRATLLAPRPAPDAARLASAAAVRRRLGLDDRPYLTAFSSTSPNKNIPRLLEAFRRARVEAGLPHRLVLVGHAPQAGEALADAAAGEDVRFTGYLPDDELEAVLAGAVMLVFPSLYEGFGLPVLEAMASGVPVACSRAASLPEVAGDAALYFDPLSTEGMAASIARLAGDAALRADLRERALTRARTFTWERTARQTLAVYREVLGAVPAARGGAPAPVS